VIFTIINKHKSTSASNKNL